MDKDILNAGNIADETLRTIADAPAFEGGVPSLKGRKASFAAGEPVLSPTPPPPVPTSPEMVEDFEVNPETGRWEKKMLPAEQVKLRYEMMDRHTDDPMGLGEDWDNSRGRDFHARWANEKSQYRAAESSRSYIPVHPEDVPDSIKRRYVVSTEVEGYKGRPVLTFGDAILMEIPKPHFEERYARAVERKKRELAEMEGLPGARGRREVDDDTGADLSGEASSRIGGLEEMSLSEQIANSEAEAEVAAGRRGSTFGGFQGTGKYNRTAWGQAGAN